MRKLLTFSLLVMLSSCDGNGAAPRPAAASPSSPEAVQRGRLLFVSTCAPCHGERGDGRGVRRGRLATPPADLTRLTEERRDPQRLFAILRDGIPGTDMPSWRALSEKERRDLVAFVRYLSTSSDAATERGPR